MKITDGCITVAKANKALTNFSPSPIHLDVSDEELMLKKVAFVLAAIHFPNNVFPVPGGPNIKMPFGGARNPVKISGRNIGRIIASLMSTFTYSNPLMSSKSNKLCLIIYNRVTKF